MKRCMFMFLVIQAMNAAGMEDLTKNLGLLGQQLSQLNQFLSKIQVTLPPLPPRLPEGASPNNYYFVTNDNQVIGVTPEQLQTLFGPIPEDMPTGEMIRQLPVGLSAWNALVALAQGDSSEMMALSQDDKFALLGLKLQYPLFLQIVQAVYQQMGEWKDLASSNQSLLKGAVKDLALSPNASGVRLIFEQFDEVPVTIDLGELVNSDFNMGQFGSDFIRKELSLMGYNLESELFDDYWVDFLRKVKKKLNIKKVNDYAAQVQKINLRNNELEELPKDLLDKFTNLYSLELSNNNLKELPVEILQQLKANPTLGYAILMLDRNQWDANDLQDTLKQYLTSPHPKIYIRFDTRTWDMAKELQQQFGGTIQEKLHIITFPEKS